MSETTAAPAAPAIRFRRSRTSLVIGIALVALSGLLGVWLFNNVGNTRQVLVLAHTVERGDVITAGDLTTARLNSDPAVHTVPAGDKSKYVGLYAATDLAGGSILTPDAATTVQVPAAGQALVGLSLTASQMPARKLQTGDKVLVILGAGSTTTSAGTTSGTQSSTAPTAGAATTIRASVVDVVANTSATNGQNTTVVDVSVTSGAAAVLATAAAAGQVAIVLDSSR